MSDGKEGSVVLSDLERERREQARQQKQREAAEAAERQRLAHEAERARREEERRQREVARVSMEYQSLVTAWGGVAEAAGHLGLALPARQEPAWPDPSWESMPAMLQAVASRREAVAGVRRMVDARRATLHADLASVSVKCRVLAEELGRARDIALAQGRDAAAIPPIPDVGRPSDGALLAAIAQQGALLQQLERQLGEAHAEVQAQARQRIATEVAEALARLEPAAQPVFPTTAPAPSPERVAELRRRIGSLAGAVVAGALHELLDLAHSADVSQALAAIDQLQGALPELERWREEQVRLLAQLDAAAAELLCDTHEDDMPAVLQPFSALRARWEEPARARSVPETLALARQHSAGGQNALAAAVADARARATAAELDRKRKAFHATLQRLGYEVQKQPTSAGLGGRPAERWVALDPAGARGFVLYLYTDPENGFTSEAVERQESGNYAKRSREDISWVEEFCAEGLTEILPVELGETAYTVAIRESRQNTPVPTQSAKSSRERAEEEARERERGSRTEHSNELPPTS